MVPLALRQAFDPRFPDFPVSRKTADVFFEPIQPDEKSGLTHFQGAIVDSACGYTVIPYRVHRFGLIKIHEELGVRPYRVLSEQGPPDLQRFAEVGLRFLTKQADGQPGYWPSEFVRIKAYLLDEVSRPTGVVLLGLDTLLEHFITHLEKNNSFLKARDAA